MVYSGLVCDKPCYNNACLRLRNISDSRSTTLRKLQYTTPVGNYPPDWAISFRKGEVKHIFFIAETKGTMDSLELRPIEQAKISCAKKLFNEISTTGVKYHDVDSYSSLLTVMETV